MKIAQLCSVDFAMLHFLLPLMERQREAGHDVVGICEDGPYLKEVRARGFRVETVPFRRNWNLRDHARAFREVRQVFLREKFDLVHTHSPVSSLIGRAAAASVGRMKIVYTAHGFYFHENMPSLKFIFFLGLEWLAGRVTDVLFTQSSEDAETAKKYKLCRGGNVLAIGNGVCPQKFLDGKNQEERMRFRQDLGFANDDVVILVIARLVAEKGLPELIESMLDVDARLLVVGERLPSDHAGSAQSAIDMAETDPVLKRRILFLGYRSDIPELLHASDIFTLPSHREGMPRSVIEAMMAGLPTVVTNIRGSREEVVHGETGLIVPVGSSQKLAEALNSLVEDAEMRRTYGKKGKARALELYDESVVIERQMVALNLI